MTADPESIEQAAEAAPNDQRVPARFGAGRASAAFALLLVAQFLTGFAVVLVWTLLALARGDGPAEPGFIERITADSMPALLLGSAAASSIVVLGIARLWAWHLVKDKSSTGLGLTGAPASTIVVWSFTGAVVAGGYLAVVRWLVPLDPSTPLGPLASAAAGGGMGRVAWLVLALAFAPVVEEFFFRGLLLSGFAASWGPRVAAVVVTVLFLAMHLVETINYWPATLAVLSLGILALVARVTSRSLIPAVAVHFTYNLVVAAVVFLE